MPQVCSENPILPGTILLNQENIFERWFSKIVLNSGLKYKIILNPRAGSS